MVQSKAASQEVKRKRRSAITVWVNQEAKIQIVAALADAGYGTSFQEGIIGLINELLESQGRQKI